MKIRLDEHTEKLTGRIIGSAFEVLNEPEARVSPRAVVIFPAGPLLIRVYPCPSVSNEHAHRKIIAVETWAVEIEHG